MKYLSSMRGKDQTSKARLVLTEGEEESPWSKKGGRRGKKKPIFTNSKKKKRKCGIAGN